jgi:hypothetical protein
MAQGCHAWFPLDVAGRSWTYALSSSGGGTQTLTTEAGPKVTTVTTVGSATTTTEQVLGCANNVLTETELTATTPTGMSHVVLDSPLDVLRADMTPGNTFSTSASGMLTAQTPLGPVMRTVTVTNTVTVEAAEDVEVGLGTQHAVRVKQSTDLGGNVTETTTWYVLGRGPVKMVAPTPGAQPGTTLPPSTWELSACGF